MTCSVKGYCSRGVTASKRETRSEPTKKGIERKRCRGLKIGFDLHDLGCAAMR